MTTMKKLTSIALTVAMGASLMVPAWGTNEGRDNSEKNIYDLSLGEVQEMIENYFLKEDMNLRIGTDAFYDYALEQAIYGTDQKLASEEYYDAITAYFVHYINEQNDEVYENAVNANVTILQSKETDVDEVPFYNEETFRATTLGDIRATVEKETEPTAATLRTASLTGHTPSKAVAYARKWANSYNGDYPNYSSDQADCTNFVSQCLAAGGIELDGGENKAPGTYETTTQWYCRPVGIWDHTAIRDFAVSTTWVRVSDFNTYFSNVAKSKTIKTIHEALISACAAGDVVQFAHATTGEVYHSVIITSKTTSDAKYCGHSNPRYDYSVKNVSATNNKFVLFDMT